MTSLPSYPLESDPSVRISLDPLEVMDALDGLRSSIAPAQVATHPYLRALAEPSVNDRPELIHHIRQLSTELQLLRTEMAELQQRRSAEQQFTALNACLRPGPHTTTERLAIQALIWLAEQADTLGSAIYLYHPADKSLQLTAHLGQGSGLPQRLELGQTLTGQAFKNGRKLYIEGLESVPEATTALLELKPKSLLLLPLRDRDKPVGILELSLLLRLSPEQLTRLEELARTVAESLADQSSQEQVRTLLEQTRVNAERLQQQEQAMREQRDLLAATNAEMTRVQQALRQSNERNRQLFRSIPCVLFQYLINTESRRHQFVYASPQTLSILGYEPERWCDEMNRHYRRMVHPADRVSFITEAKRAVERRDRGTVEVRLLTREGNFKWCRMEANTFQDQSSSILAYGVIFDIHADHAQRERLEREVQRLQASEAKLIQRLRGGTAPGPRLI